MAITGLLTVPALLAAEIDSRTIHDYSFIGVGYGYLHEIAQEAAGDVNAHGGVGQLSFEEQNFVLGVSGGYFWGDDDDLVDIQLWNVSASLGYVIRLAENHLNIIPSFGGGYQEVDVEAGPVFGSFTEDSWSILPGVTVSYAINNRFALSGGYTFAYNLDAEEESHLFSAGAKFALLEQVALAAGAVFSDDDGFEGFTAGVEFHF